MKRNLWEKACSEGDNETAHQQLETILSRGEGFVVEEGASDCDALRQIDSQRRAVTFEGKGPEGFCNNDNLSGDPWDALPLDDIFVVKAGSSNYCFTKNEIDNMDENPYTNQPFNKEELLAQRWEDLLYEEAEEADEETEDQRYNRLISTGMAKAFENPHASFVSVSGRELRETYNTCEKMRILLRRFAKGIDGIGHYGVEGQKVDRGLIDWPAYGALLHNCSDRDLRPLWAKFATDLSRMAADGHTQERVLAYYMTPFSYSFRRGDRLDNEEFNRLRREVEALTDVIGEDGRVPIEWRIDESKNTDPLRDFGPADIPFYTFVGLLTVEELDENAVSLGYFDENNLPEGTWTYGNEKQSYLGGARQGEWVIENSTGREVASGLYENGAPEGEWNFYTVGNRKMETYLHGEKTGPCKKYENRLDEDGNRIEVLLEEGAYLDGAIVGDWKYYDDGKLIEIVSHEDEDMVRKTLWNGPKGSEYMVEDRPYAIIGGRIVVEGWVKYYYDRPGQVLRREKLWRNGVDTGEMREYDENGRLIEEPSHRRYEAASAMATARSELIASGVATPSIRQVVERARAAMNSERVNSSVSRRLNFDE